MSMVIDGTNGVTFPNTTVQTVAALPLTGGQLSGNLTFATGTNGIIFNNSSAAINSTLNDYETGTWTPTDQSGASLTFSGIAANYVKIGKVVCVQAFFTYPSTASGSAAVIGGLPFTNPTSNYASGPLDTSAAVVAMARTQTSNTNLDFRTLSGNTQITNTQLSGAYVIFNITYNATF